MEVPQISSLITENGKSERKWIKEWFLSKGRWCGRDPEKKLHHVDCQVLSSSTTVSKKLKLQITTKSSRSACIQALFFFFHYPFHFAASVYQSPSSTFTQIKPALVWKLNLTQINLVNGKITKWALIFWRLRASLSRGYQIT